MGKLGYLLIGVLLTLGALSLGGYRHVKEDIIFGIDASYHDLFAGERIQRHHQSSHELRFASRRSSRMRLRKAERAFHCRLNT